MPSRTFFVEPRRAGDMNKSPISWPKATAAEPTPTRPSAGWRRSTRARPVRSTGRRSFGSAANASPSGGCGR
eukprot:3633603-Prymnesium_polylepis.1